MMILVYLSSGGLPVEFPDCGYRIENSGCLVIYRPIPEGQVGVEETVVVFSPSGWEQVRQQQ